MGEKLQRHDGGRTHRRGVGRAVGGNGSAHGDDSEQVLSPTDFGVFVDQCQRVTGLIENGGAWRHELASLVLNIPPALTDPQKAVVQSILWRMFLSVRATRERAAPIQVPNEAAGCLVAGDLRGAFQIVLNAWCGCDPSAAHDDPRIQRALRYLGQSYANAGLTLNLVAAHVNLSKWHFDRLLTRYTGAGFRRHLTDIRMLKATQLLEGSSLEVKQVAAQVGYKQLSEFDRHFRRFYGVTPTVWRKRATVRNER